MYRMYHAIKWCEDELIKMEETSIPRFESTEFNLNSEKYRVLTVDVTECTIERPKENQRDYYSGEKTTHNETPNYRLTEFHNRSYCIKMTKYHNHKI